MADTAWLQSLFSSIDRKDTAAFLDHLTADGRFRFGNAPAVAGHAAVGAAVDGFFQAIAGLRHTVHGAWRSGDTLACEGEVCYRRHDGRNVTLPFVNLFTFSGSRVADYRIYADLAPLFAPADTAP